MLHCNHHVHKAVIGTDCCDV